MAKGSITFKMKKPKTRSLGKIPSPDRRDRRKMCACGCGKPVEEGRRAMSRYRLECKARIELETSLRKNRELGYNTRDDSDVGTGKRHRKFIEEHLRDRWAWDYSSDRP